MIEHVEKLQQHFSAGGAALDYHEIAALLGIDSNHAAQILYRIRHYNHHRWEADIQGKRGAIRLHGITILDCDMSESDRVRRALRENPDITNEEIYRQFGCSRQLVCFLRKQLKAGGPVRKPRPAPKRRKTNDEAQQMSQAGKARQLFQPGSNA